MPNFKEMSDYKLTVYASLLAESLTLSGIERRTKRMVTEMRIQRLVAALAELQLRAEAKPVL